MYNNANPASSPAIAEYHPAEAAMSKSMLEGLHAVMSRASHTEGHRGSPTTRDRV